jgi:hypothetical protein
MSRETTQRPRGLAGADAMDDGGRAARRQGRARLGEVAVRLAVVQRGGNAVLDLHGRADPSDPAYAEPDNRRADMGLTAAGARPLVFGVLAARWRERLGLRPQFGGGTDS